MGISRTNVTIRKAKPSDYLFIAQLAEQNTTYHQRFRNMKLAQNRETFLAQQRESKRSLTDRNRCVVVACHGSKIIGFMSATLGTRNPFLSYRQAAFIEDVYIESPFRRTGIAGRLFGWIMIWLQRKGVDHLTV